MENMEEALVFILTNISYEDKTLLFLSWIFIYLFITEISLSPPIGKRQDSQLSIETDKKNRDCMASSTKIFVR